MIEVEGHKYRTVETLPFHGAGLPAKVLATPNGERVAVKRGGRWAWWTARDKIAPFGRVVGQGAEAIGRLAVGMEGSA